MTLKGHLFRLSYGSDLLEALTEELKRREIRAGFLSVMGAVKEATLLYYDQGKKAYRSRRIKGGLEIASAVGNISLREGEVFVHLHAVLADEERRTWGGHLGSPTEVFAVEAFVLELLQSGVDRARAELPEPVRALGELLHDLIAMHRLLGQ